MSTFVEPRAIADLVEYFVNDEHGDAEKYINRTPLDESGVWSLHQLAGKIYAAGFDEGTRTEGARWQGSRQRVFEADAKAKRADELRIAEAADAFARAKSIEAQGGATTHHTTDEGNAL